MVEVDVVEVDVAEVDVVEVDVAEVDVVEVDVVEVDVVEVDVVEVDVVETQACSRPLRGAFHDPPSSPTLFSDPNFSPARIFPEVTIEITSDTQAAIALKTATSRQLGDTNLQKCRESSDCLQGRCAKPHRSR